MILSAQSIRKANILTPFSERTIDTETKISYGLGSASYDIRIDQDIFIDYKDDFSAKKFVLASTIEHFTMPNNICGIVHDKSTWARLGIAVQNTFIDPGWCGYLTLEITNHSNSWIRILKGQGIAQIVFHYLDKETEQPYKGKYQNQKQGVQEPIYGR
jgi:dCTP deaminase